MQDNVRNTLESAPVVNLLRRLFDESKISDGRAREMMAAMPAPERGRITAPDADYRAFYGLAKELYLAVSPDTARLLYMLGRATRARAVVEFGTSFGVSTVYLAAALRDNGGGRLIGTELEPSKAAKARANLAEAGLDDLTEIREGDALETLSRDLPETIDLVLLDGHKPLYPRVLDLLLPRLRPGSCLVADNADASPEYIARVRAQGREFLSVPFGSDVELTTIIEG